MTALRPSQPHAAPPSLRAPIHHVRCVVRPDALPPDVARRIAAQDAIVGGVLAAVAQAIGVAPPEGFAWPKTVPPGWWWAPDLCGHCDPGGSVTLPAVGTEGVDLGGDGDHRLRGLSATAAAIISLHEAAHAAHVLRMGADAAAAFAEARGRDDALPGWRETVAELSVALFRRELPAGFDHARRPRGAPGSLGMVDAIAERLAAFAVPPVSEAAAIANMARADAAVVQEHRIGVLTDRLLARLDQAAPA